MAYGGPRLYRFYNYELPQYIGAPVNGWNPDVSPSEVPDSEAPVLDNFLLRPGKIVCRGGISVWADLTADAPLNACGIHPHLGDSQIIVSQKVASSTAYVDPWNAPIIRPTTAGLLAAPNLNVRFAQGGTTITTVVTTAGKVPGPRGITFEGLRYYISYGTSTAPANDVGGTYLAQATSLCTQSGATFTELTNAPHGAVDIKSYLSRIWLLGGIDTPGAGTTFNPLALFFTNPISNGGGSASADWKDPVSGLTNKIVMDGDSYDPGVAIATGRNVLIILRYQSVWALRGTSTASFVLTPVSRETGCVDARSVVETDRGVYFLSGKGLMLTDGTSVTNVSGTATQTLQNAISVYMAGILEGFGGYATCARVSDGQILVSIGISSVTGGVPDGHIQPSWCGLFNPATNTWVRLTSAIWALDGTITVSGNNYPGWAAALPDKRVITVGDKYITQLEAPASDGLSTIPDALPAGAGANDPSAGTQVWSNPGGITGLNDGSGADATGTNSQSTEYLVASSFGFAIPAGATISGIKVEINRGKTSLSGPGSAAFTDKAIQLMKAGVRQATNKADLVTQWPTPDAFASYGGALDLWGTTWTPADVNNAGFGVSIQAAIAATGAVPVACDVDFVRITVYYSVGAATAAVSFVQNQGLYDKMADGTYQAIPAVWHSHFAPLGIPQQRLSIAKRLFADYVFQGDGILAPGGWTITPKNHLGVAYESALQTSIGAGTQPGSVSGGNVQPTQMVQHFNSDFASEMDYLYFEVAWSDVSRASAASNVSAELYGVGVEMQRSRDQR